MSKNQDVQGRSYPHPNSPHRGEGTKKEFARNLRNNATPAERVLWQQLRLLKYESSQVPIGKYIADFACHYPKLVVELDGGQHNESGAIQYDEARTKYLEDEGFRVMRFWNIDVFENLEGVVDMIRNAVKISTLYANESAVK